MYIRLNRIQIIPYDNDNGNDNVFILHNHI